MDTNQKLHQLTHGLKLHVKPGDCTADICHFFHSGLGSQLGRVENGNQMVFQNLLAFFAAVWYID